MASCEGEKSPTIDEQHMSLILSDLILADHFLRQFPRVQQDSVRKELMESLLKIHNMSRSELESNLYLYSLDYDRYEYLIKGMVARYDSLATPSD